MSSQIFQLAYVSKRRSSVTDEDIVDGIVLPAITKNRLLGLTGCLWFDEHHFFQVLEGALDAVELMYERISTDRRHESITRILCEDTGGRRFERFGMRAIRSDAARSMPELVTAYSEGRPISVGRAAPWWNPLARSDRRGRDSATAVEPLSLARRVIDELAGWSDATPA